MTFRCSRCGLSGFEDTDGRCPQCLRKGGLIDQNAPGEGRQWGPIVLLSAVMVMPTLSGIWGAWDLTERYASQSWPTASARATSVRHRRLRCDVEYVFNVGAIRVMGDTSLGRCPGSDEDIAVSYDPDDPLRHRAESGIDVFVALFGVGFGAFSFVVLGGVLLYMLFPQVEGLRRFAARVGSKQARAARGEG